MNYFPLFADLTGRPVLVVGGGSVAARKVGLLLKANAQVRIVARQLNEELSELERQNKVLWIAKEFNAETMVVARSGIGIYTNYGNQNSAYGMMPDNYFKTWLKADTNWDFTKFTPDVVFINLGTKPK